MCERFIKFIPSKDALHLARKHRNAFVLLMFIAHRARRFDGEPDGLTIGQCHLGDHKEFGLTEKEYRTAKKVLAEKGFIKIVETCRTRKSKSEQDQNKNFENSKIWATERATRTTTIGTLVELCGSIVWDINLEMTNQQKGDQKGDRGATEGRPKGDEQEGIRKKKKEKNIETTPTPSSVFSKIKFRAHVELTQEEHDGLLAKHGIETLKLMLDKLDSFKGSTGKVYKSDYFTMKDGGWVLLQVQKDLQEKRNAKYEKPSRFTTAVPPGNGQEPTKFEPSRVLRDTKEDSFEGNQGAVHE